MRDFEIKYPRGATPLDPNKNIGVFWEQVPSHLAALLADVHYWIANNTYSWDEAYMGNEIWKFGLRRRRKTS